MTIIHDLFFFLFFKKVSTLIFIYCKKLTVFQDSTTGKGNAKLGFEGKKEISLVMNGFHLHLLQVFIPGLIQTS